MSSKDSRDSAKARLQERRPTKITDRQTPTMMLVGEVANRTAIIVDDLADTATTLTVSSSQDSADTDLPRSHHA